MMAVMLTMGLVLLILVIAAVALGINLIWTWGDHTEEDDE